MQVERLVIPAIAGLVDTWKRSFSFRPLEPQLREDIKRLNLVVITGTTLLSKSVAVDHPPSPQQGTESNSSSDHVAMMNRSACCMQTRSFNFVVLNLNQPYPN